MFAPQRVVKNCDSMVQSWRREPSAHIDLGPLGKKTHRSGRNISQHWKRAGPQADKRSAAAAYLRVDHRANFANASKTWMNMLFLPHCLYRRHCDLQVFVSYGAFGSNGLLWPCIERECMGSFFFQPDPDGDTEWCHCCDLNDYTFIVSTEFVPSEVPEAVRHSMGMGFVKIGEVIQVLKGFLLNAR